MRLYFTITMFKKDKCFKKLSKTKLDQLNYLINKNKDCFKKDKCFKKLSKTNLNKKDKLLQCLKKISVSKN